MVAARDLKSLALTGVPVRVRPLAPLNMHIYDHQVWPTLDVKDLWVYDKLILSTYLGHLCGPAGLQLPYTGKFIVKPITNILGMGLGTYIKDFTTTNTDDILPGYFWMEIFKGDHLSVDVVKGKTDVIYKGISSGPNRFSKWIKLDNDIEHPQFIVDLSIKYGIVNYECIGNKIIEVHLRANPDWQKYKAKELIPVWNGDIIPPNMVIDADGDRLGFVVIK